MIRQYHAQRTCGGPNPHRAGTVPVGTVVYLQDGLRPLGGVPMGWAPVRRNPWQVVAWLPREYTVRRAGRYATAYIAGGHLAVVQSLRDGRVKRVADWLLLACIDAGFEA